MTQHITPTPSQTPTQTPIPTITVTATPTPVPTVVKTPASAPTKPRAAKKPPSNLTTPKQPAGGAHPDDFDQEWALKKAKDIVEDIESVDERLTDGIEVDGALRLLSGSFERLADAGVPPGLSPANYLSRVHTLQDFAAEAAEIYRDDPMTASAKYVVVRKETGVLFAEMNRALGTKLALPR